MVGDARIAELVQGSKSDLASCIANLGLKARRIFACGLDFTNYYDELTFD